MPDDRATPLPRTAPPHEVLRVALDALDAGARVVIATVLARHGSAPSTPGQKLVLVRGGSARAAAAEGDVAVGTVGGGAVEKAVLASMADALAGAAPAPRVDTFRLGPELGMCCGGSVEILIEPVVPPVPIVLVGAGHVGVFTAPLLASLGFRVTLAAARAAAAARSRLPAWPKRDPPARSLEAGAAVGEASVAAPGGEGVAPVAALPAGASVRLLHAEHDDPEVVQGLPEDLAGVAFLVMTHDHQLDQAAIEWAIRRGFGYVGGVGSRAKAARTRARLEAKGFAPADVARVRMPVGVDVGARTPAEIGVSIAAELVAWRAALERASRRSTARAGDAAPAGADGATTDGAEAGE